MEAEVRGAELTEAAIEEAYIKEILLNERLTLWIDSTFVIIFNVQC